MKLKFFVLVFAFFAMIVFRAISTCSGAVITFDDIPNTVLTNGIPLESGVITNGYQGFNWANFGIVNGIVQANNYVVNGYYYGMKSISNVVVNEGGTSAEIDSLNTNFDFLSAYLTGGWNSNLNIEVQGFSGTNLLYDTTVIASATNATLFTFDYLGINRLTFNSFGGQNAGFTSGSAEQFAMDNFTFEFVPEPSSLLLAAAGALLLCPLLTRKRP